MKCLLRLSAAILFLSLLHISLVQAISPKKGLLPPWFLLQAQLSAVLNTDPCVHVGDLVEGHHKMNIHVNVCDYNKAEALAVLVKKNYEFGNIQVTVNILSPDLTPVMITTHQDLDEVVGLIRDAFAGNKYFVAAGADEMAGIIFIEFKPEVVQFYSDDISDWYLNTNLVASEAFNGIMNIDFFSKQGLRLYTTTSPIKAKAHI